MTSQEAITQIEELVRTGMLDAAEAACRQLVIAAPGEPKGWLWLGLLALARRRGAEAEGALRQAVSLQPGDARYWNSLALALRLQGKAAEGESAARNALT